MDPAGHQALLPGQVSIPRGPSPGVLTACLPGFTGSFLAHGFLDSQGHSWPTASLSMVSGESTDLQTQLAANRIHHASYRGFSRSPAWAPSQPDGFWFSLLPPAGRVPPASLQPRVLASFLIPYAFRKAIPLGFHLLSAGKYLQTPSSEDQGDSQTFLKEFASAKRYIITS